MLGGARAKPVVKSGWGQEGKGVCYGRRKRMGGSRITIDRGLSPQTPELSPFSALLKENQKRQQLNTTLGDSPITCTSTLRHPLELSAKKDPLSPFIPAITSSPALPTSPQGPESSGLILSLSDLSIEGPPPCLDQYGGRPMLTIRDQSLDAEQSSTTSPTPSNCSQHISPSPSSCKQDISSYPTKCSQGPSLQSSPLAHGNDRGNVSIVSGEEPSSMTIRTPLPPSTRKPLGERGVLEGSNGWNSPESARRSDGRSFVLHAAAGERRSLKSHLETPDRPPSTPSVLQGCPHVPSPLLHYLSPSHSIPLGARDKVLALCEQQDPLPLQDIFSDTMKNTLTKLGEGAFAEVFGCLGDDRKKVALKIIPIEGDFPYNDAKQASFQEILPEMVVTRELNLLGVETNKENMNIPHFSPNFLQIYWMRVCKGKFPDFLMDAWENYDREQRSENDVPDIFPDKQLYLVFAAEDAGMPLEEFVFHSFDEALSIMTQVAGALAVGEAALEFEHRDLHRGNVLVRRTSEETVYLRLGGEDYLLPTRGVRATIVDYTLSRIKQGNCVSYNNLSKMEWLFTGNGDIQFEVYRDMRKASNSNWESFTPVSNVLWMNYMASKISQKGRLKDLSNRAWRMAFRPYRKDVILKHSSAVDLFINVFAPKS